MVDSAAAAESDRLGGALVELEADGVAYGEASLTVALHGELEETERLDGDVRRVRVGGSRGVPRARVRAAEGEPQESTSRPRAAGGVRDPMEDRLPLRPGRGRRGPHADPGRDGIGQEFRAQLPVGRGAQVRSPHPDPGPGRLVPLADPLPGRAVPGARAGRGRGDAPAPALRATRHHAHVPVPDRLGASAPEARRVRGRWSGHERDPRANRRPVCPRSRTPDAERAGRVASVFDVAGLEPLDGGRRVGRVLR